LELAGLLGAAGGGTSVTVFTSSITPGAAGPPLETGPASGVVALGWAPVAGGRAFTNRTLSSQVAEATHRAPALL